MAKNSWLWLFRRLVGISADPAHYMRVGDVSLARGDLSMALRGYDIAIELDPQRWEAYEKRGVVYAHTKEFDKALADFGLAIAKGDDPTIAYQNRAATYDEMGKADLALADYGRALDRTPDYWPAHYNRAVLAARLGDRQQAAADARRCQELGLPAAEMDELWRQLREHGVAA